MNIRSLEHLLAVAETGSFSKAAERCFITQSALSRSIQTLETDLGGQLLDRIGKRNELTPLGQQVVERSRGIVREAAELKRVMKDSERRKAANRRKTAKPGSEDMHFVPERKQRVWAEEA